MARRLAALIALSLVLGACAARAPEATPSGDSLIQGSGTVSVMYAGSLTGLFEKKIGPAFGTATGFSFQGEGKGSVAIANLIKGKVRTPDVFISADPTVNSSLQGAANGNYVSWWVPFVRTELVVGWSPRSRFAADFEAARQGRRSWQSVLAEPGLRLGRTDPELDPKGYRTLWLFQLDEERTGAAGEGQRILGAPDNPAQIFPEEQLVARLQSGQLDAGIFYTIEAIDAHLSYLSLPASVNQGDPAQAAHYARVSFTTKKGTTFRGSPILYTVTIPSTVRHDRGAEAFVQFLLSKRGRELLAEGGLLDVMPAVSGDPAAVPAAVQPYLRSA